MSDPVIGIDLGTTNSEVAILDHEGRPRVLTVDGARLVPSVVSSLNGTVLVGRAAANNAVAAPSDTIRWIKRRMGEDAIVAIGDRPSTPPQVSALILGHLKAAAEQHLGAAVHRAVITVPAFFGERAREATREAARLAGLEVLRLVNEPTAAAAAYARGNRRNERWLVYDLGGGTFDASIVDCSQSVMEVRASHGDIELGGHDFDLLLARAAAADFKHRHGIDLESDGRCWSRVLQAAEAAKIQLSSEAEARVREEYLAEDDQGNPLHLDWVVSRTGYEAMIRPLIERTLTSVHTTLQLAGLEVADLSRVLLVGGATRTPLVRERLTEALGLAPQAWVDPDLVVAQGAAIEAAILAGETVGTEIVDVTPHTLGVAAIDRDLRLQVFPLIRRNSPLPCTANRIFYRSDYDQHAVIVDVYQGEHQDPERCRKIGTIKLEGVENDDTLEVYCRFDLDRSGILRVSAVERGTGERVDAVIERREVVRSDLSALEGVAIAPPESVSAAEVDDPWADEKPDDEDGGLPDPDGEETAASGSERDDPCARAEALLAAGSLASDDHDDLAARLAEARAGGEGERQALADLLYFLE